MAGKQVDVSKQGAKKRFEELCKELVALARDGDNPLFQEDDLKLPPEMFSCQESMPLENSIDRLIRLKEVLEYIPVSKSSWWAGVKSGRYPAPVHHLGPRVTAWKLSAIKQLVDGKGASHA